MNVTVENKIVIHNSPSLDKEGFSFAGDWYTSRQVRLQVRHWRKERRQRARCSLGDEG